MMPMLPPYPSFAPLVTEAEDAAGRPIVQLPRALFALLLRRAAASLPFDEAAYLADHADLAARRAADAAFSPREHFLGAGYLEGRRPAVLTLDEPWYLAEYPDVAAGIAAGAVASAAAHYNTNGWAEARAARPEEAAEMRRWQALLAGEAE